MDDDRYVYLVKMASEFWNASDPLVPRSIFIKPPEPGSFVIRSAEGTMLFPGFEGEQGQVIHGRLQSRLDDISKRWSHPQTVSKKIMEAGAKASSEEPIP